MHPSCAGPIFRTLQPGSILFCIYKIYSCSTDTSLLRVDSC